VGDYRYNEQAGRTNQRPEYWWKSRAQGREKDVHKAVFDTVRFLDSHQMHKHEDNLRRVRLYGNLPVFGLSPLTFATTQGRRNGRVRINVCRSVVDTATAHIAKERPRPVVMTDGADYRLKRHAKKLSKFVLGVFQESKVYKQGPVVFRDGGMTGTGVYKSWIDWEEKKIKIERVFIDELLYDDSEASEGMPQQIHQRKFLSREVVLQDWGMNDDGTENEHAVKIKMAPQAKASAGIAAHRNLSDMIQIVESWHLPSGPNAKDGRRAMTIDNDTLLDEEWKYDRFPFSLFLYGAPVLGMTGLGIVDQITGIQVSINKHVDAMERELDLSVSRIIVEEGAKIPKSHWVNRIGAVLTHASGSAPPTVMNPNNVTPGRREQIGFLIQQAYENTGVNQMSATGKKPSGLNSGKALREYDDIGSERFAVVQQSYEDTFVDLARLVVILAQELYTKHPELQVKVANNRFLSTILFSEIDIEENQYEMSIFPTSMLPKTPAARYAQIDEWIQAGYLSKEEGMQLMDMPDLEDAVSLVTAAVDDIDQVIDDMIYREPEDEELEEATTKDMDDLDREQLIADMVYLPPDSTQNLQIGMKRMLASYLRSKHDGTPEARRNLLTRWMSDAGILMKAAAPPPPVVDSAGAPGGPGAPGTPAAAGPPQGMPPQVAPAVAA